MSKKAGGVAGAVGAYVGGLTLEGVQRPLGELALLLAGSLEASPEYARARLARELRDLLDRLVELEEEQRRESEARRRQAAWAADG